MTQKIFVQSEDKVSKAGKPYSRFKDDAGVWMSAFDEETITPLKANLNKPVEVTIQTTDKGFVNIRSFDNTIEGSATKVASPTTTTISRNEGSAKATMYVSYAKDIFLGLLSHEHLKCNDKKDLDLTLKEIQDQALMIVQNMRREFE